MLQTNGAIKANVKIHVPLQEPAEEMLNVVLSTIKHCVLVPLDSLATREPNVSVMSIIACPILVEPTPDVSILSEPLIVSAKLDVLAMPELDASAHLPKWTDANSRFADPMLSADRKMVLVNATALLTFLMETRTRVVHHLLEVGILNFYTFLIIKFI